MKNPLKRWDVTLALVFFLITIPAERYEVFALLEDQTISFRDIFTLALYKNGNYQKALSGFEACVELDAKDGPALTMVSRCESFIEVPPAADWDHVFTLVEKG